MLSRNHGSTHVSSRISLTGIPFLIAYTIYQILSALGILSLAFVFGCAYVNFFKTVTVNSRLLIAFCKDSFKVHPMEITSPTDFIYVVSVESAVGNFSNANLGTFVTT